MRSWFAVLSALALGACASGGGNDVGTRTKAKGESIAEGVFHCGKSPGPGVNYPSCNDIPIIVLLKPTPNVGCLVVVPYAELFVHGNPGSGTDKVKWNLHAPSGYKFAGTGGVKITPRPHEAPVDNVYVDGKPSPGGNGRAYQYSIRSDPPQRTFNHAIEVVDGRGNKCDPIDPLIHND